jgi:flagellar basal-body rod modification protein FlgD
MAAMAGILNHQMTAGQALTNTTAAPMAGSTSGTDSGTSNSSSDSATISANDFLTLLVTEMRNQDPTADTDPNEYINQLVSVNSLEQLIDINQNLSTALGTSSGTSGTPSTPATVSTPSLTAQSAGGANGQVQAPGHSNATALAATRSAIPTSTIPGAIGQFARAQGSTQAPGNLSIPEARPAAQRVAGALNGRSHSRLNANGFSGAR